MVKVRYLAFLAAGHPLRRTGILGRSVENERKSVAVGFLGTELIEAQGLAMTSGYI